MNLDRYFERIGWRGSREPTRDVLAGLLAHHMQAIPFENLDVLLGRPPSLELDALEAKLVVARRGGYCYEHSTLVAHVLRTLGFVVATHSARVVMYGTRDTSPRTHMFLTVGDLMLDPGFGGMAPRTPVPRDGTVVGGYRLTHDGTDHVLEHAGQRLWVSSFEHDVPIDFVMANHFTATHPSSPFTRGLMMRAYLPDGQLRLRGRDVTWIRNGETTTAQLTDRAELRALVAEHFGFDLPAILTLRMPLVPEWD